MTHAIAQLALLLAASPSVPQAAATFDGGKTSTTVQAEMVGRYFQFDALVNGKKARLILDTGAGLNVLTPDAAKKFGVEGGIDIPAQGAGAAPTPAKLVTLDSMQVGDALVKSDRAVVIELPAALQCDGLVGYTFLRHFATTFDYENARLTFTLPTAFRPPADAKAVELKIVGNHPRIMGSVDGIEGWFTLDTGANGVLTLMTPFVEDNKLREKHKVGKPRITGKGVGGYAMGQFATLDKVTLAGFELPPLPGVLSAQKQGAFAAKDVIGNVGAEIMNRFLFTLDYVGRKAYFAKKEDFGRFYRVDRSGMYIDGAEGKYKVVDVAEGSPAAEAGVQVGDEIVEIDGQLVAAVHPLKAGRPLQAAPGTKVKLTFSHAGSRREVEIVLRDL